MTKVVFLYDFDKTLSPKDMQEYGFIESLGIFDPAEFWKLVDETAKKYSMDRILAYMYLMIHESKKRGITIKKEHFVEFGKDIELFEGVPGWFERISAYGKSQRLEIEHVIVSSGLKPMIEATSIAQNFSQIYACDFVYDENNAAIWPAMAINYTTKTQFLFRINKGVRNVTDDVALNSLLPSNMRPVPFDHMIYFGDGLTDVPSMKLVTEAGGFAVAVFNPYDDKSKMTAQQLVSDGRVEFMAPADYSLNSPLERLIKLMIQHIVNKDALRNWEVM
ncbi:MAG: HAD family hydrolase [Erysipelotrichaceae bacterium]|nr:HAD family hydrolase [Erysipelotrichaceae bacterium]MDP3304517.1 HAD family hydrolase [Erysipelotrichaceae bacterium]